MNRRTFFSRLAGVVASLFCAPAITKAATPDLPVFVDVDSIGISVPAESLIAADGGYIVPPELCRALNIFFGDGKTITREVVINCEPGRTLEDCCRERGVACS